MLAVRGYIVETKVCSKVRCYAPSTGLHSAVRGVQKLLFSFVLMLCAWIACHIATLHISWTVHVHVQYVRYWQCNILAFWAFDLIGLHATNCSITVQYFSVRMSSCCKESDWTAYFDLSCNNNVYCLKESIVTNVEGSRKLENTGNICTTKGIFKLWMAAGCAMEALSTSCAVHIGDADDGLVFATQWWCTGG